MGIVGSSEGMEGVGSMTIKEAGEVEATGESFTTADNGLENYLDLRSRYLSAAGVFVRVDLAHGIMGMSGGGILP